jgi:hypothetical protein
MLAVCKHFRVELVSLEASDEGRGRRAVLLAANRWRSAMVDRPNTVFMVMTNPVSAEDDAEYNRWYTEVHLPDILAIPGFVAATRYRLSNSQRNTEGDWPYGNAHRYLAIYEVDPNEDINQVLDRLGGGVNAGMVISDTLQREGPGAATALMYEAVTERMTAESVRQQTAAT